MKLAFIETPVFTKLVTTLGLEESLRRLQLELVANPLAGDTDPGTGGLRKVRMSDVAQRRGKRGGYRVHYLLLAQHGVIYLLFVCSKLELNALTPSQKRTLRKVASALRDAWPSS